MRLKSFFFFFFLIGALAFAQAPEKFTYQSVIKNSSGYLLKNQEIGLRISILFNSVMGFRFIRKSIRLNLTVTAW